MTERELQEASDAGYMDGREDALAGCGPSNNTLGAATLPADWHKAYVEGYECGYASVPLQMDREYEHEEALEKWARRYDDLNGAPESEEDR
jgi:hypothetical protein